MGEKNLQTLIHKVCRFLKVSRNDGIRTRDLFVPNEALYQAEPHLEIKLPTLFRDSFISISQKSLSVNTFLKYSLNFLEQLCHQTAQLCAAALGSLVDLSV